MYQVFLVVLIAVAQIISSVARKNVTEFNSQTTVNIKEHSKTLNASAATTHDLLGTTCNITSENLIATATATVSAAFNDFCKSEKTLAELEALEHRLQKQMETISAKIDVLLNTVEVPQTPKPQAKNLPP